MIKTMTIVGTRPELIKMSRVISEFDTHTEHVLVHTGQNYDYELNQVFFEELQIRRPDHFLEAVGPTVGATIGRIIERADAVIQREQPQALLLYGDTNSCLSVIAAKRHKVPIFHMEAGNRCFDQRVPEEINRRVVDHLSDINLVLTEHARRYLIAEGIRPETIFKTGSHMQEVIEYYLPRIQSSQVLSEVGLKRGEFIVVSAHREENIDDPGNMNDLLKSLDRIAETYGYPVIVSTHPRTQKRIDGIARGQINSLVQFVKPFGFFDYVKLQMESACVVSDSGTITEESALLNFPAVTIRNAHERPEGMDVGTLIMCGLKPDSVINAINVTMSQHKQTEAWSRLVPDYEGGLVSRKLLRIVISYCDYVNRTVWRR